MQQPQIARYVTGEIGPWAEARNDDDIISAIRQTAYTGHHPCSTARMGADSDVGAVLDSQLRVRGIEGLRVADASIMPVITSGNTNAPAIMIGEKASDMILEDAA